MTCDEYIQQRADAEGLTVEQWSALYDVYPCVLDDPDNQGWQAAERGKPAILPTE